MRSATFNLGVLQALAGRKLLRSIDYLSTVSGGGYIGSFLGRFYTRYQATTGDAASHIEKQLVNSDSPEIDWLRTQANYLAPDGAGDATLDLGIYLRNLVTLHFVLGTLLLTFFGIANLIRFGLFPYLDSILPPGYSLPARHRTCRSGS